MRSKSLALSFPNTPQLGLPNSVTPQLAGPCQKSNPLPCLALPDRALPSLARLCVTMPYRVKPGRVSPRVTQPRPAVRRLNAPCKL